jgi:cytoskeletal protein CcmA (bactofilin family)
VRVRRGVIALAALVVALLVPAPAHASDIGADDEILITGTVTVPRGQYVDRIWIADGKVDVSGHSEGSIVAISAPVRISGTVDGDVITLAKRITLTPSATINGDLIYADERPIVPPGATVYGDVRHLHASDLSIPFGAFIAVHIAIWLAVTLSSLALGLVLLWLAPRVADAAFDAARTGPGPAIGWGAAVFFGLPLAAIVALVTLVGIPLGLTVLLALLPLFAIGYVTSASLLGGAIVTDPERGRIAQFLAGWGILRAIALIPFLGGLAALGATVFGLGVLAVALWRARSAPPPPADVTA